MSKYSGILKRQAFLKLPNFRIPKLEKTRADTAGLPSGALVYVGEKRDEPVTISLMNYNAEDLIEKDLQTVEECFEFVDKPEVTWINVNGIHDTDVIEKIGKAFKLHPSILGDIVDTSQRPRIEDFDDYIFVTMKMMDYNNETREIISEHVCMILGKSFILTFQEREGDVFNSIRQRIRKGKGRIRHSDDDYLFYAIIDAVVDNYFVVLEKIGEAIEDIEIELIDNPETHTLQKIYIMKREMIFLRKSVWPLRDVIGTLDRSESELITEETGRFLRNVYDHTIQTIDMVETYRDMLSGMLDLYLSSISNRMNEVMKVLTIIATIFIPLTFIAGIYGMNFNPAAGFWNMPELGWEYGYLFAWAMMLAIGIFMLFFFRKKKWL